jgi:hypothetical protein
MKRFRATVLPPILLLLIQVGLPGFAAQSAREGQTESATQGDSLETPRGIIKANYRRGFPSHLLAKTLFHRVIARVLCFP